MALVSDVQLACSRLAAHGWHSLLLQHGLDITAADLQQELTKPLSVDRTLKGFEDFSPEGERGIEAGRPAESLLYHALASPNVLTAADGSPLTAFPSALEIEQILNFVYGVNPPSVESLSAYAGSAPLAIVVFAYEYRPRPVTVHKIQADLCFSRTGVARTGTAPALYDAARRGFLPFVEDDAQQMRVIPARYGAYIAMQKNGDSARFGPMSFQSPTDENLSFWVPIHKLFNGKECLLGLDLTVQLENYQINEKIRQVHRMYSGTGWQEPDILNDPFVITEGLCHWAEPTDVGAGLRARRGELCAGGVAVSECVATVGEAERRDAAGQLGHRFARACRRAMTSSRTAGVWGNSELMCPSPPMPRRWTSNSGVGAPASADPARTSW